MTYRPDESAEVKKNIHACTYSYTILCVRHTMILYIIIILNLVIYIHCTYLQHNSVITYYHEKSTRNTHLYTHRGGWTHVRGRGDGGVLIKHGKYIVFCDRACVTPIARPKPRRSAAATEDIRRRRGLYYPAKGFTAAAVKDFKEPTYELHIITRYYIII